MAKIRIADASLSLHCSLAAAAAARHGRSSLLTAQNVSFEPHNWRQAASNQQEIAEIKIEVNRKTGLLLRNLAIQLSKACYAYIFKHLKLKNKQFI